MMRHGAAFINRFLFVFIVVLLPGCGSLPSLEGRAASMALTDTQSTRLGKAIAPRVAANPGKSGVYPLLDSRDAFAARVLLAGAAERSLDVQYYIWHDDLSGRLLFQALLEAAQRGVRVRLLLDDNNTSGLDAALAGLDAHPNIEVRLFNPFAQRGVRWLGYLTDFARLNRRMHNKSFTADNQATIIGGRNVGDEYFDATQGVVFVDLDALAVGPVVNAVSADFDRYWASGSSYPVDRLLPPAPAGLPAREDGAAAPYLEAVKKSPFVTELMSGRLALEWAETRMVSDDPAKALGADTARTILPQQLKELLGEPRAQMDLVSAYFVPGAVGEEFFTGMARRGVKVRVLTNSLEATDVAPVHAGYAKRRKALLEAGVTLYELRRMGTPDPVSQKTGPFGSSGSSLHAKAFGVDRMHIFIGSFNFDPRSARLNTEMGFVIDSPALTQRMGEALDRRIPAEAYEVRLTPEGKLYWLERRGDAQVRYDVEPGTTVWKRLAVRLLSLLPIEWLL
jgi:cardiolipin synthase C